MDDKYPYVIAEDVVTWVTERRIAKGTFEDHTWQLWPNGRLVAEACLAAIVKECQVQDYSWKAMIELQGWQEVTHTLIFCSQPYEEIVTVAEKAAAKWIEGRGRDGQHGRPPGMQTTGQAKMQADKPMKGNEHEREHSNHKDGRRRGNVKSHA